MIILIVDDIRNLVLTQASEISTTTDQYYSLAFWRLQWECL